MNFKMPPLLLASCLVLLNACSTTRTGDRLVSMNEAKTLQADEWTLCQSTPGFHVAFGQSTGWSKQRSAHHLDAREFCEQDATP